MSKLTKVTFKLLDLIVIFVMMFSSPMSVFAQDPAPVLTTDKTDYLPGDIAQISGMGFTAGNYVLTANGPEGSLDWGMVPAGEGGSFITSSPPLVAGTYQVNAYAEGSDVILASVSFTVTAPLPTIISDKSDYAPGELVTLTGENWQGDAQVRIFVNESVSPIWSYEKIVNVDADGTILDSFILPSWFVAEYTVSASGQTTGRVITTTFTDLPGLTLTKSASPLIYTAVGQIITFSYVLKNTGTIILNGPFTVTDNKVSSVSCPATTTLAVGASITCTGVYTITAADMALGYAVNTATASSSNPDAAASNTDVRIVSIPMDCRNDSDGANDVSNQKDLTKECNAPSSLNPQVISWNWDDISMSGKNSADGCALFDINNNGLADYALCVSWLGNRVMQIDYPVLYQCNDSKVLNCGQAAAKQITNGTTCALELADDDPFSTGNLYPNDTKAFCSINLADVGGASKSVLIDVCSYTSASPSSVASDCVVISTAKGNLEVIKNVDPDDPGTNWNISWTGPTPYNGTITGDGVTGIQPVNAGTYTITETSGTGTDLNLYDSTWACTVDGSPSASGAGTTISGISVTSGKVVICTFTNTRKTGTLEIKKVISPSDPSTNWNFAVTGPDPTFKNCSIAGTGTCGAKTVFTGSYSITETAGTGTSLGDYGTTWACTVNGAAGPSGSGTTISGLTINKSDTVVCTFTNSQNQATLVVKKVIVNDNGGAKGFTDFSYSVNGGSAVAFEADGQNNLTVSPGSYTVTEPAVTGYTTTYSNCSNISIPPGGSATCTITNDDQPGTLTVKKVLINDNGGTKAVTDFSFSVNDGSAITFETDGQNDLAVNAGSYSVVESAMAGYSTTYENCLNVVIPNGGSATCTITNNDNASTLIVIKHVVNDNGGSKFAGDFNMSVTGASPTPATFAGQEAPGTTVTLNAGAYTVTEAGPSGYTSAYSADCSGTIAVGQTKTCTVTNDDQPGTLIVKKVVVNDSGGALAAKDFSFQVNGGTPVAFEADGQNDLTVNAGTYNITESAIAGYSTTYDNCADVVVPNGGSATCTITNDDRAATLHVVKVIVNDNGGAKGFTDFSFSVNGGSAVAFEADGQNDLTVNAGTYNVVETAAAGYTTTYNNCSNVVIPNGGEATCTITNNDQPGTLIVRKVVINNNGGTLAVEDFSFQVNGGTAIPFEADGQNDLTVSAGTYTVAEPTMPGYSTTYENCTGVVIPNGGSATCTITNDDQAGTLIVKKVLVTNNGSLLTVEDFKFSVNGGDPVAFEADGQNEFTVNQGLYSVVEPPVAGFTTTYNNCTDVFVPNGGYATCTITNDDQAGTIIVEKQTDPDGIPGEFTFSGDAAGTISDNGQIVVSGLSAGTYSSTEAIPEGWQLTGISCYDNNSTGDVASATATFHVENGETVKCVFTNDPLPTVDLNKSADPLTLAEPGGVFTFTISIHNTSVEQVKITALTDTNALSLECLALIDTFIPAGGTVSCSYPVTHTDAGSYINTASVTVVDNEGNHASDSDSEAVSVTDVLPTVTIIKTADPSTLPEPGGAFTFTLRVKNTSVEVVTITALTDDNPLSIQCSDLIGDTLTPNQEVSCTYTVTHTNAGNYPNTASVTVKDNENNTASDSDDETVTVTDVRSYLSVVKSTITPTLPEPGGTFVYKAVVSNPATNLDPITVSTVVDSYAGDISTGCDVTLPITLDPGASFTCNFTYEHLGDYPMTWTNTITATGTDDEGLDASATSNEITVSLTDVLPNIAIVKTASPTSVPETGANVEFTIVVTNNSTETATLTALTDTDFDLTVLCPDAVGTELPYQQIYTCTFTQWIQGNASGAVHENTATVTAADNDGNSDTASDNATVAFIDVAPAIDVTKTANPASLPETGGSVTFTFRITNTGPEDVTVTSIVDDKFGNLLATAEIQNGDSPVVIPAAEPDSYFEFTYTTTLASDSLTTHVNRVDVTAVDNDGTPATDWDDETVTFNDVAPLIRITKSADPTHVPETGGNVTFTFLVENIGVEDVTLTSLTDDKFGNLAGQGTCTLPQPILVGGSYTCTVTKSLSSDSLTAHTNVVTATAVDDDNTPATDTDDETVTFDDVAPVIQVTKTASSTSVPETGGDVTFTFLVENTGVEDVTLTSLSDTIFGDLDGKGTCDVPQTILIGGSYTCTYTVFLASDSLTAHYNVVTATAVDDDDTPTTDTDDETVTFDDVKPDISITKTADPTHVPETGSNVTFTFVVKNDGVEDVTLTSLTDSVFGDLNGQGDCATGGLIVAGGSYSCSITVFLASDSLTAHTNLVTAVGTDDDGSTDTATDDETVTFDDVAPAIRITKTADPTHVPETGGNVTFTFLVENIGAEDVTLTTLSDTKFGDLDGKGTCGVPQTILIGGSYSCTYTVFLASDNLTAHTNVVTATAVDDDGTSATDDDDETVTFDDVAPIIRITKSADPTHVPETGGNVTFTFLVENIGVEDVSLTSLVDTKFGDLNGQDDCAVPQTILIGGSYSCSVTMFLAADDLVAHTNVVTAIAVDDDNTPATDTDDETVTFDDIFPTIVVTKEASSSFWFPGYVPETGGLVDFMVMIENTSPEPVTITSISDTDFDLADLTPNAVGVTLAPADDIPWGGPDTYMGWFTRELKGEANGPAHENTITATAEDNDGNTATDSGTATIPFWDELPEVQLDKTVTPQWMFEPGGVFTYTLKVTNIGPEAFTIKALTDDNLTEPFPAEVAALIGRVLQPGESVLASYPITHTEPNGQWGWYENKAMVWVQDNEGNEIFTEDVEAVFVQDVPPEVKLEKFVDPATLPEPGGDFNYILRITNLSTVESVWVDWLEDTHFTNNFDQFADIRGTEIPAGQSIDVPYAIHRTEAGIYDNYAWVSVSDNDGGSAFDDASATVQVTDVLPTVDLTKSVMPASLDEPGGKFTYTLTIRNTSVEEVTITALTDDNPLPAECTDLINTKLAAGDSTSCSYTVTHIEAGDYSNSAFVTVEDNEGNQASDTDSQTVTVTDVLPTVDLTKTVMPASLPEPGGEFTYTLTITNTSVEEVTITALADDNPLPAECTGLVGTTLAASDSTSCSYTVTHTEAGTYPNTASVTVEDNEGNSASDSDSQTVTVTDIMPTVEVTKTASPTSVPETGGDVTFTFVVKNTSTVEPVTITSLSDSIYGTLAGDGDCMIGTVLAAGASCEFSFIQWVEGDFSGPDHVNIFTAHVKDNENNDASDDDDATVDFTDVAPAIEVTKTADPTSVPETGGDVSFTFVVKNTSTEEPVTITSMSDNVYDTLDGDADCKVSTVLAAGASCEFSITHWVEGDFSKPDHVNVFSTVAEDNDGTEATNTDDATVDFTDVAPAIEVTKTANPTAVPETGGNVLFTFMVTNTSSEEAVIILSLSDSVYGTLPGDDNCKVGTILVAGNSCTFLLTKWVEGDFSGAAHYNVFTAVAEDNDGTDATDIDDATVDFENVLPTIEVTKTADPTSVPETGGDVVFTFVVKNTSTEEPVTITSLVDSLYGTLAGDDNCKVGTILTAGDSCTFLLTKWVEGDFSGAAHYNVFTAVAEDNDGTDAIDTDDATVDFTNVLPTIDVTKTANPTAVPETGGDILFTFVVKNTSTEEPVTITSLSDSHYGTLDGDAGCKVGTVLAAGTSCDFTLTKWVEGDFSGPDHVNVFTAVAEDDDGTDATNTDDATVDFTNVLPTIDVTKTADPTAVLETGGNVVFTFVVTNTSTEEPVTITSLSDSVYNTLAGDADCKVGTLLAAGASCDFTLTKWVEGDFSGPDHVNVFTAKAVDNDNTEAVDSDDATVDFTNVLPAIEVTKTASQKQVFDPGENVTFTFKVKNTSTEEPVTITSLSDSVYGTLLGDADCKVNTVLAAGASCEFTITRLVASDHTNVFTAKAVDNDGSEATDDDDASVEMINPHITITKVTVDGMTEGDALNIIITEPISWKYTVKNDGDVTLTNVAVTDSQSVNIDCDGGTNTTSDHVITSLAVDASVTCTATGTAAKGNYNNTGTASTAYTDTDSDNAPRSASDSSSYFGADPQIDIVKKTVGSNGAEGDGVWVVINEQVTWKYLVTNTGNVTLSNVTVTDNKLPATAIDCGSGTNVIASLAANASVTCTATGINTTPILTTYTNTGYVIGYFTDSGGHSRNPTDQDNSSYFSRPFGLLMTNTELCSLPNNQFNLLFTPDLGGYKLNASNPGQFYYNMFYVGPGAETVKLILPYPWVVQGNMPIHIYNNVTFTTRSTGQTCLTPGTALTNPTQTYVTLGSYPKQEFGQYTIVEVPIPATGSDTGFLYVNIHLDYGLKDTTYWSKGTLNQAISTGTTPPYPYPTILDQTDYIFKDGADTQTTIKSINVFKKNPGIGGLVYTASGAPVPANTTVTISVSTGKTPLTATVKTDADGWYMWTYKWTGKPAEFTVSVPSSSGLTPLSQKVWLKANGYLEVDWNRPGLLP